MKAKKLQIFCITLCILTSGLQAQKNIQHTIYYSSSSYELSLANEQKLKSFLDSIMLSFEINSIRIKGNTDNTGSDSLNFYLSQKRAVQVKNFFIEAGFPAGIILTYFMGETSPVASNEMKEGKQLNRRCDIEFIVTSNTQVGKPEKPILQEPKGDIGELYTLLQSPSQEFCIDISRDTLLVGKRGTIVEYKANTISRENFSCHCVTLRLDEYFDKSEMILNNLTTTSDGKPLESGGMIRLKAYCDGKMIELKEGQYLTVMVPTDIPLPGMKILSANRQSDNDYLNWKIDPVAAGNPQGDADFFNYSKMLLRCGFGSGGPAAKCPFFFCRIANLFRGAGKRKGISKDDKKLIEELKKESDLLIKYELKGEPLETALRSSKQNSGKDALNYYVYKKYNWDYNNIDRFMKAVDPIDFFVKNNPDKETDIKMIYKMSKTVVPAFEKRSSYLFNNVDGNSDAWLVGIKFTADKKIFLGLKSIKTSERSTSLEFSETTLDELKLTLKQIDK